MKTEIPCLRRIAEIALKYVVKDADLRAAYADLEEAERESKARYQAALRGRGVDCQHCGRTFLPHDGQLFCSIGCQFSDEAPKPGQEP